VSTAPSTLSEWKDLFELFAHLTVVLGVPAAIYQYRRGKLREQTDREYGTYNALDEKYLEFQRMCFDHPRLDIFDIPDENPQPLDDEQRKQELIAFTMLISVFERAYLMYHDQSNKIKTAQWSGWDEYIRAYCERANFRNAWEISGETFDRNFENYVEEIMQRSRANDAAPRLSNIEVTAEPRLERVRVVTEGNYLSALRLVSQYGWAGGAFNTNELSYLIQTKSATRTTTAFVFLAGDKPRGLAIVSAIPAARLVVVHEMTVAQSVTREATFAQFWSLLLPALGNEFPSTTMLVAEVPQNEPRHLKTEVFVRGLGSVGFRSAPYPYYLPNGLNHRSTPVPARLYVQSDADLTQTAYMGAVSALYSFMYRPLWQSLSSAPDDFERDLRLLQERIGNEVRRMSG
jgi:hypothetical protein